MRTFFGQASCSAIHFAKKISPLPNDSDTALGVPATPSRPPPLCARFLYSARQATLRGFLTSAATLGNDTARAAQVNDTLTPCSGRRGSSDSQSSVAEPSNNASYTQLPKGTSGRNVQKPGALQTKEKNDGPKQRSRTAPLTGEQPTVLSYFKPVRKSEPVPAIIPEQQPAQQPSLSAAMPPLARATCATDTEPEQQQQQLKSTIVQWRRLLVGNMLPLCSGHAKQCVERMVKKVCGCALQVLCGGFFSMSLQCRYFSCFPLAFARSRA